jgi:hypothetical protein
MAKYTDIVDGSHFPNFLWRDFLKTKKGKNFEASFKKRRKLEKGL